MKDRLFRLVLLGIIGAAGFWGWRLFFPSPEHIIRQRLSELAVAASISPNEAALTKLAKTQKLASFFTDDARINLDMPGRTRQTLSGREEIQQTVMYARSMMTSLTIKFVDISVAFADEEQSALAHLTATANMPGEKLPEVQELDISFKRFNRDWLINRVESVKTLR
jgi:hypothetical protein